VNPLRNPERQVEKDRLAAKKHHQVSRLRSREAMAADPSGEKILRIPSQLPADRQQPVQQPEIDLLPAMKRVALLVRSQLAENAEIDVGVMAGDAYVGVMKDLLCFQCQM
jgi:hypothetical protein